MKKIWLLILFLMVLTFGGKTNVLAANRVNGYGVGSFFHAKKNDGYFSKYGQLLDFRVIDGDYKGEKVYCFAPSEELNSNIDYDVYSYKDPSLLDKINSTQSDSTNRITKEQLEKMKIIAYYGYGYTNRSLNTYKLAAQMLIYQTIENQVFTDVLCSNEACKEKTGSFSYEIGKINDSISKHFLKPSFDGSTQKINLNETKELTDSNKVLDEFEVESCQNCEAEISGYKLNVKAKSAGPIKVTLVKGKNLYSRDMVFFTSSSSQNMIVPGNIEPVYSLVNGNVTGGSIEVEKVGENGEFLQNAQFDVYNSEDSVVCSLTTKSDGKDKCSDLDIGEYYIVEKKAPVGYVLDTSKHYVEITEDNLNIKEVIRDEKIRGDVELFKEDKETKHTQGDALLSGAAYGLYKSDGTKIGEMITNGDGYYKYEDLEYGDYYIKELKPSTGYLIDENRYDFQIRNNKEVIKVTSKEQVQKFDLELIKVMSSGGSHVVPVEENAVFQIFDNNTGKLVGEITTNPEGKAKITLPYGTYKVCQKSGNSGTLVAECFTVVLHDNQELIVNNEYIKAKLKVVKINEATKEVVPLKGIKFKIKNLYTGEYVCQTVTYPNAKKYCVFETNKDGILITPDYLIAGNYQLEEIDQVIPGYLWNKNPLVFKIDNQSNITFNEDYGYIMEVRFANLEVLGSIDINKLGEVFNEEDVPLKGIKFGVYNENKELIGEIKTDEDGYARIDNLKLGKYYLKELETIEEYLLDDNWYEVNLEYQDQYTPVVKQVLKLRNNLIKGKLNVYKKSDDGIPIEGVKFNLYDENNNLLGIYTTDKDGLISILLPYGKYYLEEAVTKVGYKLDEEIKEIIIDEDEINLELVNERLMTKVNLLKVNSDGEVLEGVKFNLYDKDGNLLGTYVTDKDGYIKLELPYGEYYFQEIEALDGYFLDDRKLEFVVDSQDEINLTYENYYKIRVPSTSSYVDNRLSVFLGIGGLLLVKVKRFKKKKAVI